MKINANDEHQIEINIASVIRIIKIYSIQILTQKAEWILNYEYERAHYAQNLNIYTVILVCVLIRLFGSHVIKVIVDLALMNEMNEHD